jgi:hypothetical protein
MTYRITFLGGGKTVCENPRIGVCNACRSVFGEVDAQTGKFYRKKGYDIHHELYDFSDPTAYTLELCPVCHGKYDKEQGIRGRGGLKLAEIRRQRKVSLYRNAPEDVPDGWVYWSCSNQ